MSSAGAVSATALPTDTVPLDPMQDSGDTEDWEQTTSSGLSLLMFLLLITIFTIYILRRNRIRVVHESGMSILFGVLAGLIIDHVTPQDSDVEQLIKFDPNIFFFLLLPLIIFNAGYQLQRKTFFGNMGVILMLAMVGTLVATFITGGILWGFAVAIGMDNEETGVSLNGCLLFGALISATDPVTTLAIFHELHVDPDLYAYIFGESVLNDAVAFLLYHTIKKYGKYSSKTPPDFDFASAFGAIGTFVSSFIGSMSIGIALALILALGFKYTTIKDFPVFESAIFVVISYSAYTVAWAVGLSGIVSILFCGIVNAHYTYANMSVDSKKRTKDLFEFLNFLAENFIFSYLGISLFTVKHEWSINHFYFIVLSLVVILAVRAMHVFPITIVSNYFRNRSGRRKVNRGHQIMIWFSGLRGAVAFALATDLTKDTNNAETRIILATTLVIVIFTVIGFGSTTVLILRRLGIPVGVEAPEEEPYVDYVQSPPKNVGKIRAMLGCYGSVTGPTSWWNFIDHRYLTPLFVCETARMRPEHGENTMANDVQGGLSFNGSVNCDDNDVLLPPGNNQNVTVNGAFPVNMTPVPGFDGDDTD